MDFDTLATAASGEIVAAGEIRGASIQRVSRRSSRMKRSTRAMAARGSAASSTRHLPRDAAGADPVGTMAMEPSRRASDCTGAADSRPLTKYRHRGSSLADGRDAIEASARRRAGGRGGGELSIRAARRVASDAVPQPALVHPASALTKPS